MMKQLPVIEKHKLSSGLQHAYALSIVLANPEITDWYNESYILPIIFEFKAKSVASPGEYLDSYAYSNISAYKDIFIQHGYSERFIPQNGLINCIKEFINDGNYVVIFVDEFYLLACNMGGKNHFLHEELIYGYNDEEKIFYSLGINSDIHYGSIKHKYEDLLYSYNEGIICDRHGDIDWARENRVITIKPIKKDIEYKCDKNNIFDSIKRYLSPSLSCKENFKLYSPAFKNIYLGLDCYKYISECVINGKDVFPLLHLMFEHKDIFTDHLIYLNTDFNSQNYYKRQITKMAEAIRMLGLKRRYVSTDKQKKILTKTF